MYDGISVCVLVAAEGGAEGIFDVFDGEVVFVFAGQQDDVKLDVMVQGMDGDVGIGGGNQVADFLSCDDFADVVDWLAASLDLHKDEEVAFLCDDVDFMVVAAPVTFADDVAVFEKQFERRLFAFCAE